MIPTEVIHFQQELGLILIDAEDQPSNMGRIVFAVEVVLQQFGG